ncbi:mitochondrial antiviral-signaling protein [Puntigrus tetrazona]|uniref:mitochondrial antiviral-signaling protein n=1 Tax=Puntigrus tetrazona TaxID=1606681 RepID=UPI001C890BC2|nr:mitochondrial antiviral-signaling protein [Puntigrus tetrazona]XP_043110768.1 mitochondrial antiviral-signaling protein [Puntigrus tetrazona]XP_043110769.1 mitochondrial antiviral-signaling protein [Puntigrus tetrazona]XP_043110771.1 mitochondrial antiviral-signaling protein [Puntigrus tetrazona]
MSFIREQFYNEAIRPNLARFSSTVKVRDILPHLSCLTITDREEVEAKRETSGNFTAMQILLDNLRRREKWPDEFITALRNCEHRELADEMSAIYDRIRGITNKASPAPRTAPAPAVSHTSPGSTTTKETVHAVPATAPPLLITPSGAAPESSTVPSNNADPEPSPAPVKPPTSIPAPSPEPVSPPDVAPPVLAPSQARPSPEISVSEVSLPVPTLTGAAENKTPALDSSDGLALMDQTTISLSTGEALPSISSAQTFSSDTPTPQSQITKPNTTSQTSQKSKKTQVPTRDKYIDISERLPVQDSNPPLRMEMTFQEPEEISDPTATEVVQQNNTVGLPVFKIAPTNFTTTAQATSSAPAEVDMHSPSSIDQEYFSKPGVLHPSEPQQNRVEIFPEEPCSVVSDDLEISNATVPSTEPEQSTRLADQNSASSSCLDSATQSFQDPPNNAAPLIHNQPEEDHYESFCGSHTEENVIQFAEEPSAENMNGQPPSMLQRKAISEDQHTLNDVGTENTFYLSEPSGHDSTKSTSINVQEEESSAAREEQREEGRPQLFSIINFHLFAAAGIGLSAAFLAWKFSHK